MNWRRLFRSSTPKTDLSALEAHFDQPEKPTPQWQSDLSKRLFEDERDYFIINRPREHHPYPDIRTGRGIAEAMKTNQWHDGRSGKVNIFEDEEPT